MLHFYVYVDGSDLDQCETNLTRAFSEFAACFGHDASFVSDKYPRTPDMHPDDLPQWNLGINFRTIELQRESSDQLISFLIRLGQETGRDFAIGLWRQDRAISDDLMFVGGQSSLQDSANLCSMVNGR
jgi:hypothetical protein